MANILSNLRLPRQCFWSEVTFIYLLRHYLDCMMLISLAFLTYILQLVLILKNLAVSAWLIISNINEMFYIYSVTDGLCLLVLYLMLSELPKAANSPVAWPSDSQPIEGSPSLRSSTCIYRLTSKFLMNLFGLMLLFMTFCESSLHMTTL